MVFELSVREIRPSANAGVLVPLRGHPDPSLRRVPNPSRIDLDEAGQVVDPF